MINWAVCDFQASSFCSIVFGLCGTLLTKSRSSSSAAASNKKAKKKKEIKPELVRALFVT